MATPKMGDSTKEVKYIDFLVEANFIRKFTSVYPIKGNFWEMPFIWRINANTMANKHHLAN